MTALGPDQTAVLRRLLIDVVETPPRRRATPRGVVTAAVAVAAVVTVVAAVALGGMGSASAHAAELLRAAATRTITTADPVVQPGQYLKITTDAAYLSGELDAEGELTAYISLSTTEVYAPADRTGTWVERTTARPATTFYGDAARAAAARDWAATQRAGVVQTRRAAGGVFDQVRELGGTVPAGEIPDSAAEALAYLRGTVDPTDVEALSTAAELLRDGTLPAVDRAVIYQALALVPGIRIADRAATLDGREGVAFSLDAPTEVPQIIIDPLTGQFIGERTLTPGARGAVPAGAVSSYTAVRTTVVDSAP